MASTSPWGGFSPGSNPGSPTNSDILKIQRRFVARSSRLRRGFARILPYISARKQRTFENQKNSQTLEVSDIILNFPAGNQ